MHPTITKIFFQNVRDGSGHNLHDLYNTQLTPYRIFLANTALTQLSFAVLMIMVEPKMFTYDMTIVVVYLGPVQYMGSWYCYMLLITMREFALKY
ncbi:hypothetical protein GCK32_020754 [Trichostrongylus colubriformis]|uniref:Uncharacterized protein n=1 Tax=Trichostrongylus colubriformis TaxID=6319 RepID=A0AAN8F9W5_TRICO